MNRACALLLLGCVGAAAGTTDARAQPAPDTVVAKSGTITLTAGQVSDLVRYADPALRQQLQHDPAALARYVRDRLVALSLLAQAHAQGWDTRPEIVWRADRAREQAIVDSYLASQSAPDPAYPSDAEVQAAYEANKSRLMLPRQYHLAQIFLADPSSATRGGSADAAAQKRLQDVRTQLAHRGDFASLARKLSQDRVSAANGGDLGWVREDQLLPTIRDAVMGLPDGSVSDPIHAADGWHLLRLIATRPAAPAPLDQARAALVQALRQQKMQDNARALVARLLQQQPVQIDEIQLPAAAAK